MHMATTSFYATVKSFCPKVERRRSTELLALGKVHLTAFVGVLTGHWQIGIQAVNLKILLDASEVNVA